MNMKLRSIVALALWLVCAPALAQVTPGTSPLSIVKGGTNASTAAAAAANLGAPSHPVVFPSSGNLAGSGCFTAEAHSLWWVDQNLCSLSDVWVMKSNDPSALFSAIIGGTITPGDRVRLTFTFAGACAAGCNADYITIGGDTATTIAAGLSCAIANNATLFNLNGGTCTAGKVTPAAGQTYGGYATGKEIGYVVSGGTTLALNYTVAATIKVVASVTGAATETVAIQIANCATVCDIVLDNNPSILTARNAGIAPPANSIISNWQVNGTESTFPALCCTVTYGQINHYVENSTTGSLAAKWCLSTVNTNNTLSCRVYAGRGFYTAGVGDQGVDTINTKEFWINSAYRIYQTVNTLRFDTLATNHPFVFNGGGGFGYNVVPSAAGMEINASVSSIGNAGPPIAGAGATLQGGPTPQMVFFNWGTSAYLPGIMLGLSWDFKPSNSATSGWTLSANSLVPDGDNVTVLGSGSNRISTVTANAMVGATYQASSSYKITTKVAWSATAPTVSSGFCTSPSISNNNGTAAFTITIGSACAAAIGVLTMPAASVGWACNFVNVTNNATSAPSQTASSTTSVNVTNYVRTTGVAGNWTASDVIVANCTAY